MPLLSIKTVRKLGVFTNLTDSSKPTNGQKSHTFSHFKICIILPQCYQLTEAITALSVY